MGALLSALSHSSSSHCPPVTVLSTSPSHLFVRVRP